VSVTDVEGFVQRSLSAVEPSSQGRRIKLRLLERISLAHSGRWCRYSGAGARKVVGQGGECAAGDERDEPCNEVYARR
jgi:hypothetical protein